MIRIARVAGVNPQDHSLDLVMVDDGSRIAGAQLVAGSASSNSGTHDIPTPSTPKSGDKWSLTEETDCDMIAVVAQAGQQPVVLGFLYPQVSQMLFKDPNRRVMRHASDVYSTIDGSGNFEMAWPNGTYVRVGSSPDHEDLSGKDVDGKWSASKNTSAETYIRVGLAGGKATLTIDPAGNISIENQGNFSLHSQGNVSLTAAGNMAVTAANLAVAAPTAVTGASLTHNGTNVGDTHVHSGITPGPADTGGPH